MEKGDAVAPVPSRGTAERQCAEDDIGPFAPRLSQNGGRKRQTSAPAGAAAQASLGRARRRGTAGGRAAIPDGQPTASGRRVRASAP